MPNILDIFNDDAFSVAALTATVNEQPFVPGQVGALGIFEEDGVDTLTVAIESQGGDLTLVAPTPRGGPGETTTDSKRAIRDFRIPHFQRDDAVMADEVQGVRAFGSGDTRETVQHKVNQRLARHTRAMDATLEHQRIGAIKGVVTDKNGAVLEDLYNRFDIARPKPIALGLNSDTTKLRQKVFDVVAGIEDDLDGVTYSHIHAFVGADFWKALIEHKSVKETYLNTVQAAELRGDPMVNRFEFAGIVWERYRTGKSARSATGADFIAPGEARFVPVGVPELFLTRFAPADYVETVNTIGLPRYAKQYPMPNGKGVHLEVQMNALSICTRPGVLREGTIA